MRKLKLKARDLSAKKHLLHDSKESSPGPSVTATAGYPMPMRHGQKWPASFKMPKTRQS